MPQRDHVGGEAVHAGEHGGVGGGRGHVGRVAALEQDALPGEVVEVRVGEPAARARGRSLFKNGRVVSFLSLCECSNWAI